MRNLSLISTSLTILCAIHCALMPIFLSLTPFLASQLVEYHWMEWLMIGSSFVLGGIPLVKAYSHHEVKWPIGLFITGFLFISLNHHHAYTTFISYLFTFMGAVLLITPHVMNAYLLRQCKHK